jgi:carboxyl-terminal processing protease
MGKKYMLKSEIMLKKRNLVPFILIVFALGISFLLGFLSHACLIAPTEFGLLNEAYQLLDTHYIETLPERLRLEHGMIRGMLEVLDDPFTVFSVPEQHRIQTDTLAGEYGGIGALITTDGKGNFYIDPFAEGPAAESGILEGARLLAVDGLPIEREADLETIVEMLRGIEGTEVSLRIRNPEADGAVNLVLERVNFPLPSVSDYILPGYVRVGVIKVNVFSEKTPGEVERAIEGLMGRGIKGLIMDLRNNGGGLLDSAIGVSQLFLREGIIVSEERRGIIQETHLADNANAYSDIPLAVVVDSTSASAAEVVAAALQENQRAFLIGTKTFGKGSIQVVVELSDGSSMRITSSRWLTPDGEMIDESGLEPEYNTAPERARSEQILIDAAVILSDRWDQE